MKLILKASQVKLGIKVEKEHKDLYNFYDKILKKNKIKNPLTLKEFAKVVATDHIEEISDYYDRLIEMEKKADAKEEGGKKPTRSDIIKFLKKHPNPKDEEELHKYADKKGFNKHKFEEEIYKFATSKLGE